MIKTLLFSDHDLINDLYSINLGIFVDAEVIVCPDEATFESCLTPDIQLIISLSQVGGKDAGLFALNKIKESASQAAFILIGEKSEIAHSEGVETLPGNLNLQLLVRTIAKRFAITAKDMALKDLPDFYPIPIKMFSSIESSPCDVFVKMTRQKEEYAKIASSGQNLVNKVKTYLYRGVDTLYIPKDQRVVLANLVSQALNKRLQQNLPSNQAIDVVEEGFEFIADQLSQNPKANEEMVKISQNCVKTVQSVIRSTPKIKALLQSLLENKSRFIYMHSVMTTYIANHIIRNISWGSDEHAEKVSFVLFFHDMFLIPVYNKYPDFKYEEDLIFNDTLSDKEKELVLNHARMASEMVRTFPRMPMGADAILQQHHGMNGGVGFALEFKDDISPLAKVIIVAEEFVNLALKAKDDGVSISIDSITNQLRARFTRHTYKKIIETLDSLQF
ncbi:MAG: hypothetical protein Fur0010_07990 [Bdellovibrio sp.]